MFVVRAGPNMRSLGGVGGAGFCKRDDPVVGPTNLLSLAVHFLTLIEFVVRRKLIQDQEKLVGLIENNPKRASITRPPKDY